MKKKAQFPAIAGGVGGFIGFVFVIFVVIMLFQAFSDAFRGISCQNEKSAISDLQNQLSLCKSQVLEEQQKCQNALSGLGDCNNRLTNLQTRIQNCTKSYQNLQSICNKKEQPLTEYYFIKVYENKIILFESIVLYNIQLYGLLFGFGISFTIKIFDIDLIGIHFQLLNKRNQKQLIKEIKQYLVNNPYTPVIIMLGIILLTNILIFLF